MKSRLLLSALCSAACLALAPVAHAAALPDPAGDFLSGYTGSHNGDLDVISASVSHDAASHMFDFSATMNAPIDTTSSAFYVWGIDRGTGTEKFNTGANPIGAGVKFDTVVIFRLDGTATIGSNVLHDVTWSGNTITGSVPESLLPSLGLAFDQYGWNLWPRDGTVTGNAAISDFAPDASDGSISAVPEPASFALLGLGLAFIGAASRRRRAD